MNEQIVILSGGHGGARIARELLRQAPCSITLVINAFDDGKSTGALRAYIPGMLGPSDIRKNLSQLIAVVSPERFHLRDLLEFRLDGPSEKWSTLLRNFAAHDSAAGAPSAFIELVSELEPETRRWVREMTSTFLSYEAAQPSPFFWEDSAFGNILFAGVYLSCNDDFNAACADFASAVLPELKVVNATRSGAYFLRGITEQGTPLLAESRVIAPPAGERIERIFIHDIEIDEELEARIGAMSSDEARNWLTDNAVTPDVSMEARSALEKMDTLVIAPGTPHSSLFPTLVVLAKPLKDSPASARVLIGNLDEDDDVIGFDHYEIIKQALSYGGDSSNETPLITDLLVDSSSALNSVRNAAISQDFAVRVTEGRVRSLLRHEVHSASATAISLRKLARHALAPAGQSLCILVDPTVDPLLLTPLIEDFCDIRWDTQFSSVSLLFRPTRGDEAARHSDHALAERRTDGPFSASVIPVDNPLEAARSQVAETGETVDSYVLRISGDGYYSLADAIDAVKLIELNDFDMVFGSRVQDRRQLSSALETIYGERGFQRRLAELGAGMISAAIRMRQGLWLSDPLSGFVLIRGKTLASRPAGSGFPTVSELSAAGRQVGELPVRYFTLAGFTTPTARIRRGVRVLRRAARGEF